MNKKAFGTRLLAVVVYGLPVLGLASQVEGSVDVTLLDKTYTRATGAPTATLGRFTALPGTATLTILNLGEVGLRVSSAVVKVNGVVVFGPADFSQHAARLEAAIEVARQNELSVELRGQPGGSLELAVAQEVDAAAALVVGDGGGTLTVADAASPVAGVQVTIPPGAFAQPAIVTIKETAETLEFDPARMESTVLNGFSVESTEVLLLPATVSSPVSDCDGDGLLDGTTFPLQSVQFYRRDRSTGDVERVSTTYDASAGALVAFTGAFSHWIPAAYRWKGGTVYYSIDGVESLPGESQLIRREIHEAFDLWDQALTRHLTFYEVPSGDSRADILIGGSNLCGPPWSLNPWPRKRAEYCQAAGYATPNSNVTAWISTWKIHLNAGPGPIPSSPYVWFANYSPWPPTFQTYPLPAMRVAAHELSHALGIDFDRAPCNPWDDPDPDVTAYECNNVMPLVRLSADDIKRIRDHYGLPPGPGGRLFYLNRPDQTSTAWSIWETDLHRQTSRKLTDLTGFFHVSDLVVSSDGERLAFWATLGGGWDGGASGEVYVLNTDPTNVNLRQVTSLPGAPFASAPRWSPSNQDILYYQYNPGSGNPNESITRLDLDTSRTTTYPQGYGQAAKGWDIGSDETTALIVREPWCCWHPNAFTAYYDLASGGVQSPFVRASDGRSESSPRINRTDGWIAFLDEVQGGTGIADIFLMNPSGGEKAALTNAPAASRFGPPIWAGGNHTGYVVFETSFFGASEIVAMKAGDAWPAGVIRLTSPQVHAPAGDKLAPAWTARR